MAWAGKDRLGIDPSKAASTKALMVPFIKETGPVTTPER